MNKLGATLLVLGTLTAAGCQTPQQKIGQQEDMLVAAGFRVLPVNTPARQASFKTLPPNRFAHEIRDGRTIYLYPDPVVCGCLYIGDQKAYGTYNFNVLQKNIADQRQAAADALMANFSWGPWGGPPNWMYN